MITDEMIAIAKNDIITHWGENGKRVIEECAKVVPFNGNSSDFLEYCNIFGGNWGAMLLTGIYSLWPDVWEAIPDDMGHHAWLDLCSTLILCGVDTSEK